MNALMPSARDKDLSPDAQLWFKKEVEAGLYRLLALPRQTKPPCEQLPAMQESIQEPAACPMPPSVALPRVPEGDEAGEDSLGMGNHTLLAEDAPVAPRVGPLPTLLTSGRSWEKLIVALGEKASILEEKIDKMSGESFGERAA
mmetsp:Transcript_56624/g.151631  ORF Transcript_56624/g.151631 Transcript_56624/m.151631 type:complete len:144 (-) Transcript_56624:196-627(-)